tara:strand:+ start:134 stop:454 length:321 start_codon:yes stop_codon:yes gene_type:complete
MTDFEDFNLNFKKEFIPFLKQILKKSNMRVSENLSYLFNDQNILLNDLVEYFSKNKEKDINDSQLTDIEMIANEEKIINEEYDELCDRLKIIRKNLTQIENHLINN